MRRINRAEIAGQDVRVFKPETDDRAGDNVIGSHNGETWTAEVIDTSGEGLRGVQADVVAVDEANFFDESLVHELELQAKLGRRVIVAGIDQTFRGEPFTPLPELMAVADYVEKLRAICVECGKPATKNQRIVDGEPASAGEPTVVVGGEERYEARCRDCHVLR